MLSLGIWHDYDVVLRNLSLTIIGQFGYLSHPSKPSMSMTSVCLLTFKFTSNVCLILVRRNTFNRLDAPFASQERKEEHFRRDIHILFFQFTSYVCLPPSILAVCAADECGLSGL